jgi:hypothetical protein
MADASSTRYAPHDGEHALELGGDGLAVLNSLVLQLEMQRAQTYTDQPNVIHAGNEQWDDVRCDTDSAALTRSMRRIGAC